MWGGGNQASLIAPSPSALRSMILMKGRDISINFFIVVYFH